MKSTRVLSVAIAPLSKEDLRKSVVDMLRGTQSLAIAKVNAEFLLRSLSDQEFRDYLHSTHLNIADGVGVLWAARFLTLKTSRLPVLRHLQTIWQAVYSLLSLLFYPPFCKSPIPERIPGVDALMVMLAAAQDVGAPVYFLGATSEVNARARESIRERFPSLKIAGGSDGYADRWDAVVDGIDRSGARLLIVALGCPKQELWIRDHLGEMGEVRVAVGEGGSLDFVAGNFRRAPKVFQALGLEWLWRLFMNRNKTGSVSRARRIWNAVPVFVHQTVRWKLRHGWEATADQEPA